MNIITLTPELENKITHWSVSEKGNNNPLEYITFKKSSCKNPSTAANRARRKGMEGVLIVTGLTMHAETKPIYIAY